MIIAINLMIIGFWLFSSGTIDNLTLRVIGYVTYLASTAAAAVIWEEYKRKGRK